jgi:phosphatidylserine/phosphatidylglycerophosphate/cardiolipin synthase-like enzyme
MTDKAASMAASAGPILDPMDEGPPALLVDRPIFVQPEIAGFTTIVVPHDPVDDLTGDKWFAQKENPPGQPTPLVRDGNEVKYLFGGREAFREIARAFASARRSGDFIYIIAWWLDVSIELVPAEEATARDLEANPACVGRKVSDLLTDAVKAGVQIRALLAPMPGDNAEVNLAAKDFINVILIDLAKARAKANSEANRLAGKNIDKDAEKEAAELSGALIDEMREGLVGTHHQKIIIVNAEGKLTAFCGGVDLNKDRVGVVHQGKGQPLHDVHCRIRGHAAYDLLKIFVERWEAVVRWLDERQKRHNAFQATMGIPPQSRGPRSTLDAELVKQGLSEDREKCIAPCTQEAVLIGAKTLEKIEEDTKARKLPERAGRLRVQIARTYGHGSDPYHFAQKGEHSILEMIKSAIAASERFIYFEDQYMVSPDIASLLAQRLRDQARPLEHVTILTSHNDIGDMPHCTQYREEFLATLFGFGDRLRIFSLYNPDRQVSLDEFHGSYVHAKVWVFDDAFAIIGSANCNNRGMLHDSEVAAGIYDPSDDNQLTFRFAHRLRMRLWARHLNLETAEGLAELADGLGSAVHWLEPPPGARVRRFMNIEPNRPPLASGKDFKDAMQEAVLSREQVDPKSE